MLSSDGGMTTTDLNGNVFHFLNGRLESHDGKPAIVYKNGDKFWYRDGVMHRLNAPAVIAGNYRSWCFEGSLHREDGPAVIVSTPSPPEENWFIHGRPIDIAKWQRVNGLPNYIDWSALTWSLFRLEFL